uniref:BTB domain-containing protein n=1 Tax=Elaeophora elaphi TaxID=1147741 RepID=A0A0R3RQY6_9BILA
MVQLKSDDFQQHCYSVGQYLRELRFTRDLITADVEIICAKKQTDFLHSSIGAIHSNYIRAMLNCHQTPFQISLLDCHYKTVSAIIDWMYTGQIQATAEEYCEHLKVASILGIEKLQQNLESTLQILAAQNDWIIHCMNIANDPECSVSSTVQRIICEKFVATMHALSHTDIEQLTLNAVIALVASSHIKSKEKIDTINFALQWLKNSEHSRFLDAVLGSLYIETLMRDQLIALKEYLRHLYRRLPGSLLTPIQIYIRNKQIVVSSDPRKYAKSSSVIVSNPPENVNEAELECKSAEIEKMIDVGKNTSYITEMNKLPSFDELVKIQQTLLCNN